MFRLVKFLFFLLILAALVVLGYAYLGDLSPERRDVEEPVQLNAG